VKFFAAFAFIAALVVGPNVWATAGQPQRATPQTVGPLKWSRLPGRVSRLTVALDGSLWALATEPPGPNKYLLHYLNGQWSTLAGITVSSVAVGNNGMLYASISPDGGIVAYDGKNWRSLGGRGLDAVIVAAHGKLYALGHPAGTGDKNIWKYTGTGWQRQPGMGAQLTASFDPNTYTIPGLGTIAPNGYFVLTAEGATSYFSPGVGYVRLPGAAKSIAPVTRGVYELTVPRSARGAQLFSFDYATAKFTPANGWGASLAAGPSTGGACAQLYVVTFDHAIWTAPISCAVSPTIIDYLIPTSNAAPVGITAGPDGALWFTESGGGGSNKIGRINSAGAITEYPLSHLGQPWGIAAGSDGALWFTESLGGQLGRITTGGSSPNIPSRCRIRSPSSRGRTARCGSAWLRPGSRRRSAGSPPPAASRRSRFPN
jgi:hypothetical protein